LCRVVPNVSQESARRDVHNINSINLKLPFVASYAHAQPVNREGRTAYASEEDRRRALAAGFDAHLPKPVEPAELVSVIAGLVA
jgi:CheY-like chemotaxis protein